MKKAAFLLFVSIIVCNSSCATTTQNSANQDLEVKSVEPFAPSNEIIDANSISPELIAKSEESGRFTNPNEIITTIKGEITDEMILQGKDLSLYEKSDTFKCGTYDCVERREREFIWQHWQNKKRGYIKSFTQGIDFSYSTHIFIEPNEQGEWTVIWKTATNHAVLGNSIAEIVEIVSVKQIKLKKGKILLELRNKEGKKLITL